MENIKNLFRLQIEEKLDIFRTKNKKVMFKSLAKAFVVIVVAVLVIYQLTYRMSLMGISFGKEMFSLVILVTQVISFFLCLGSIISTLYSNKDNELLMSMPVTHNQVFVSKICVLYVNEVFANAVYSLPIFFAFAILGGYSWTFYLSIPLMLLVLPLLPLALAAFVSIPLFGLMSFLKKHFVLSVVVITLLAAGCIAAYMWFVSGITDVINITGQQIETVRKVNEFVTNFARYNWLYLKVAEAMLFDGFLWKFAMLLGINVALFLGGVALVKPFFFKMAMKNAETGESQVKRKSRYVLQSPEKSLLKKEFLTVFRSPGYVFQYFIFTLLMPFIVVTYDRLLLAITVNEIGTNMIDGAHLLVVGILAMLTNIISASAISREGGNFYIMKICPVGIKRQAFVKILFNAIFTIAAIWITGVVSAIFFDFAWWKILLGCVALSLASVGHICICFDMDLMNPTLDWYDTSEITSISKNSTKGIIYGLLIAFVMSFLLMTFAGQPAKAWIYLMIFVIVLAAAAIHMLNVRLNYYFKKMEI